MKMNLEYGFLFLYDWLPIFDELPAESLKELLLALIDRQRNGTPMPHFSDPRCNVFFRIIEPTISRRLTGQKGGQKTRKRNPEIDVSPDGTGATPPSKEEIRKEKQSIAIEERSEGEVRETLEERYPAPSDDPPPPPLSEDEKEKLISLGIPLAYIEHRLPRAQIYGDARGKSVARVLLDWWEQDRALPSPPRQRASPHTISFDCHSFDTDDFFQAALKKSLSET